jgi:hypothetical protein
MGRISSTAAITLRMPLTGIATLTAMHRITDTTGITDITGQVITAWGS